MPLQIKELKLSVRLTIDNQKFLLWKNLDKTTNLLTLLLISIYITIN